MLPPDPGKIHSLPIQVFYNLPRPSASSSSTSSGPERCTVVLPQLQDVFVHPVRGGKKRKHASRGNEDREEVVLEGSISLKSVMRGVCYASPDLLPSHSFPDSSIYIPSLLPSSHGSTSQQTIHEAKGLLSLLLSEPAPGRTVARGRLIRSPIFSSLFPSPRSPSRQLEDDDDMGGGLEALMRAAQREEEEEEEEEDEGRWGLELEVVLKALPTGFSGLSAGMGMGVGSGSGKRDDKAGVRESGNDRGITRSSPIRPTSTGPDVKPVASTIRTFTSSVPPASSDPPRRPTFEGVRPYVPTPAAEILKSLPSAAPKLPRSGSSSSTVPTPTPTRETRASAATSSTSQPPQQAKKPAAPPAPAQPRAAPVLAKHATASLRAEAAKKQERPIAIASASTAKSTTAGKALVLGTEIQPIVIEGMEDVQPLQAQPLQPQAQVQKKPAAVAGKRQDQSSRAGSKAPSEVAGVNGKTGGPVAKSTESSTAAGKTPTETAPNPLKTPINRPSALPAQNHPSASPNSNLLLARTILQQQGLNIHSIDLAQKLVGKERFGELLTDIGSDLAKLGQGSGSGAQGKAVAKGSVGGKVDAVAGKSTAGEGESSKTGAAQAKIATDAAAADKPSPTAVVPHCDHCGTTETKTWRIKNTALGAAEKRVCDECGLYFNDNKKMRPRSLWGLKGDAAVGKQEGQVVVPDPPVTRKGTKRVHGGPNGPGVTGNAEGSTDPSAPQMANPPMSPKRLRQHPPSSYVSPRRSTRLNTGPTPGKGSGNNRPPRNKEVEDSPSKKLKTTPKRGISNGRNLEMGIDEHDMLMNGGGRGVPKLGEDSVGESATAPAVGNIPANNEEWNEAIQKLLANAPMINDQQQQQQAFSAEAMNVDFNVDNLLDHMGPPPSQAALEAIDFAGVQPFQGEPSFSREDLEMLLSFSQQPNAANGESSAGPSSSAQANHLLNYQGMDWTADISSSPWEVRTPNGGPSQGGLEPGRTGTGAGAGGSGSQLSPADQQALNDFMTQGVENLA